MEKWPCSCRSWRQRHGKRFLRGRNWRWSRSARLGCRRWDLWLTLWNSQDSCTKFMYLLIRLSTVRSRYLQWIYPSEPKNCPGCQKTSLSYTWGCSCLASRCTNCVFLSWLASITNWRPATKSCRKRSFWWYRVAYCSVSVKYTPASIIVTRVMTSNYHYISH